MADCLFTLRVTWKSFNWLQWPLDDGKASENDLCISVTARNVQSYHNKNISEVTVYLLCWGKSQFP